MYPSALSIWSDEGAFEPKALSKRADTCGIHLKCIVAVPVQAFR
jgi:hypothetical protein